MIKKIFPALVLITMGCFDNNETQTPYQNWYYSGPNPSEGLGLTLNRDGSYELFHMTFVANSCNAQVEKGSFVATGYANGFITFTPKAWSCPIGNEPVHTSSYTLNGANLNLTFQTQTVSLIALTASPVSGYDPTFGCFTNYPNGFYTSPTIPVSN